MVTAELDLCEQLWNDYEKSIKNICSYKLSSYPSEIDDVVGDAYLALCNAVSSGREIKNSRAWLYSTVNNLIKAKYTELNRNKERFVPIENVEHELYYDYNFEDEIISDFTLEAIKDEIYFELNDADREILTCHYVNRQKLKDIALDWGVSEASVRQRHSRLKLKVKLKAREKIDNLK